MELKRFVRLDNREMLEVTKAELEELVKKYPFISVHEVDNERMESEIQNENEVVGYIAAKEPKDLLMIKSGNVMQPSDVWFVNKHYAEKEFGFENLTFGEAYEYAKEGYVITRFGWNGNKRIDDEEFKLRMFVVYVPSSEVEIRENTPYWNAGIRGKVTIHSHLDLYTPAGTVQPGWLCSQADISANDWIAIKRKDV